MLAPVRARWTSQGWQAALMSPAAFLAAYMPLAAAGAGFAEARPRPPAAPDRATGLPLAAHDRAAGLPVSADERMVQRILPVSRRRRQDGRAVFHHRCAAPSARYS